MMIGKNLVAKLCVPLIAATLGWGQSYSISTIGGGAAPPSGVPAVGAAVGQPTAVAPDAQGNVYFTSLNCVFKISSQGVLTRVAGNGRGSYTRDGGPAPNAPP